MSFVLKEIVSWKHKSSFFSWQMQHYVSYLKWISLEEDHIRDQPPSLLLKQILFLDIAGDDQSLSAFGRDPKMLCNRVLCMLDD